VNEPLISGDWEPAAEILRPRSVRAKDLYAISVSEHLICTQTLQRTFKDREGDASQLNRLGVAYFLVGYFQFQPPYFGFAFFFDKEA